MDQINEEAKKFSLPVIDKLKTNLTRGNHQSSMDDKIISDSQKLSLPTIRAHKYTKNTSNPTSLNIFSTENKVQHIVTEESESKDAQRSWPSTWCSSLRLVVRAQNKKKISQLNQKMQNIRVKPNQQGPRYSSNLRPAIRNPARQDMELKILKYRSQSNVSDSSFFSTKSNSEANRKKKPFNVHPLKKDSARSRELQYGFNGGLRMRDGSPLDQQIHFSGQSPPRQLNSNRTLLPTGGVIRPPRK